MNMGKRRPAPRRKNYPGMPNQWGAAQARAEAVRSPKIPWPPQKSLPIAYWYCTSYSLYGEGVVDKTLSKVGRVTSKDDAATVVISAVRISPDRIWYETFSPHPASSGRADQMGVLQDPDVDPKPDLIRRGPGETTATRMPGDEKSTEQPLSGGYALPPPTGLARVLTYLPRPLLVALAGPLASFLSALLRALL